MLTKADNLEIKRLVWNNLFTRKEIAERYGISLYRVYAIAPVKLRTAKRSEFIKEK